jgi:hypothetical protein
LSRQKQARRRECLPTGEPHRGHNNSTNTPDPRPEPQDRLRVNGLTPNQPPTAHGSARAADFVSIPLSF